MAMSPRFNQAYLVRRLARRHAWSFDELEPALSEAKTMGGNIFGIYAFYGDDEVWGHIRPLVEHPDPISVLSDVTTYIRRDSPEGIVPSGTTLGAADAGVSFPSRADCDPFSNEELAAHRADLRKPE
jgi:hypothetical protein